MLDQCNPTRPCRQGSFGTAIIAAARRRFRRLCADGLHPYPGNTTPRPLVADEVTTAIAFLRLCRPAKRPTISSYFLKHAAENWGREIGRARYVSNGSLIAAAHWLGLTIRRNGLNATIGVYRRDIFRLTGIRR